MTLMARGIVEGCLGCVWDCRCRMSTTRVDWLEEVDFLLFVFMQGEGDSSQLGETVGQIKLYICSC